MLSQHFHFLKIPKTDVIVMYVLSKVYVDCVSGVGGWGGEDLKDDYSNQYFNVYALRRVRTAGYATDQALLHILLSGHMTTDSVSSVSWIYDIVTLACLTW